MNKQNNSPANGKQGNKGKNNNLENSIADNTNIVNDLDVNAKLKANNVKNKVNVFEAVTPILRDLVNDSRKQLSSNIIDVLGKISVYRNKRYTWDDNGIANLFIDFMQYTCKYNTSNKSWAYYNGKYWASDDAGEFPNTIITIILANLKDYAKTMIDNREATEVIEVADHHDNSKDTSIQKQYMTYINKISTVTKIKSYVSFLSSHTAMTIKEEEFDTNLLLLNCQNGTYNLKTNTLQEHNSNDKITKITNFIYNKDAQSPVFNKFYKEIMSNDKEKAHFLSKTLGYSISGITKEECMFMFYGSSTRNGKGTLMSTLEYGLGGNDGYSTNMMPTVLAQKEHKDSSKANDELARLKGARLISVNEPDRKMILDIGLVKHMTGNDTITARTLHQKNREFKLQGKIIMSTNFLPKITDNTLFDSDRVRIITFDRKFKLSEQDKDLKEKLKQENELSGLLNFLIAGYNAYVAEGLNNPQCVNEAVEQYRENSDKLAKFLNDTYVKGEGAVAIKDAYEAYKTWCDENGYGTENKGTFIEMIKSSNLYADTATINKATAKRVIKGYSTQGFTPTFVEEVPKQFLQEKIK